MWNGALKMSQNVPTLGRVELMLIVLSKSLLRRLAANKCHNQKPIDGKQPDLGSTNLII